MNRVFKTDLAGRELIVETGVCTIQMVPHLSGKADTVILSTATSTKTP